MAGNDSSCKFIIALKTFHAADVVVFPFVVLCVAHAPGSMNSKTKIAEEEEALEAVRLSLSPSLPLSLFMYTKTSWKRKQKFYYYVLVFLLFLFL